MANLSYTRLDNRGPLAVRGDDARTFLQGVISNDVTRVDENRAIHAAFLTPQGKFLHEFFIAQVGDALLLDCEAARAADLKRRLSVFKLRAKVTIEEGPADSAVFALFGEGAGLVLGPEGDAGRAKPFEGGVAYCDPRLAAAGLRLILPDERAETALRGLGAQPVPFAAYDAHRLALGLPDGSRDMVVEKTILLEAGFDELHGVDWQKGCYMGQELTARTKYRGLIKRRLLPVRFQGAAPAPGTPITLEGADAGEMRSGLDGIGLAMLRIEALDKAAVTGRPLLAGDTPLTAEKPSWASF